MFRAKDIDKKEIVSIQSPRIDRKYVVSIQGRRALALAAGSRVCRWQAKVEKPSQSGKAKLELDLKTQFV